MKFKIMFAIALVLLLCTEAKAIQVTLAWVPPASTPEQPVDGQRIYRRLQTSTTWALLTSVGSTINQATDTTVAVGGDYCYTVAAFNTVGESTYSNEACSGPLNGDMNIVLPFGFNVVVNRRTTYKSSIVSILVNKDAKVIVNGEQK